MRKTGAGPEPQAVKELYFIEAVIGCQFIGDALYGLKGPDGVKFRSLKGEQSVKVVKWLCPVSGCWTVNDPYCFYSRGDGYRSRPGDIKWISQDLIWQLGIKLYLNLEKTNKCLTPKTVRNEYRSKIN